MRRAAFAVGFAVLLIPFGAIADDTAAEFGAHGQASGVRKLQPRPEGGDDYLGESRLSLGLTFRVRYALDLGPCIAVRAYGGIGGLALYHELGLLVGPGYVLRRPGWDLDLSVEAGAHVIGAVHEDLQYPGWFRIRRAAVVNPTVTLPAVGVVGSFHLKSRTFVTAHLARDLRRRLVRTVVNYQYGGGATIHYEVGGWFGGISAGVLLGPRPPRP